MCREFATKMKINVWFRQGGYLFLARTPAIRAQPREERRPAERLRAADAHAHAGGGAAHRAGARRPTASRPPATTRTTGSSFPGPSCGGTRRPRRSSASRSSPSTTSSASRRAARASTGCASAPAARRASARRRGRGRHDDPPHAPRRQRRRAPGRPRSRGCSASSSPTGPTATRFCSTEPLKPWLKPLVADLSDGLYFSQSTRGEIVGGVGNEYVAPGLDQQSSHAFLGKYARSLVRACPVLGRVKVLRQWAGCYDLTPDANPIVGPVDAVEHFYQASGFMGHGFMMAPIVGKLMAELVARSRRRPGAARGRVRAHARPLELPPLRRGQAAVRGDDHRLTAATRRLVESRASVKTREKSP